MTTLTRRLCLSFLGSALLLSACGEPAPPDAATIYLIRHAEKTKAENPGLTEAGKTRAQALVSRLSGEPVDFIHSTDFRRTLETARPLSENRKIDIQIYNGGKPHEIADKIKIEPGTHVVVGHSNTTPVLAGLLSGQVMGVMEETEYNRLIKIRLKPNGELEDFEVSTYGAD